MTKKEYKKKYNFRDPNSCANCKHSKQVWNTNYICTKMKELKIKNFCVRYHDYCDNWEIM